MKKKEFQIDFIEEPMEFSKDELSMIIGGATGAGCNCWCLIQTTTNCGCNAPKAIAGTYNSCPCECCANSPK